MRAPLDHSMKTLVLVNGVKFCLTEILLTKFNSSFNNFSSFVSFTIGLPGIPLTGPTPLTPARCLRSPYDCAEICGCQRPADDPPKGVKPIDTDTRTSKYPNSLWLIYVAGDRLGYGLGFRSHPCSSHLGFESKSDSVQYENFRILRCNHRVWSPNLSLNPAV